MSEISLNRQALDAEAILTYVYHTNYKCTACLCSSTYGLKALNLIAHFGSWLNKKVGG